LRSRVSRSSVGHNVSSVVAGFAGTLNGAADKPTYDMDIGSPYVISGTRSEHPHPTLFLFVRFDVSSHSVTKIDSPGRTECNERTTERGRR
jgi:hypothetical protein